MSRQPRVRPLHRDLGAEAGGAAVRRDQLQRVLVRAGGGGGGHSGGGGGGGGSSSRGGSRGRAKVTTSATRMSVAVVVWCWLDIVSALLPNNWQFANPLANQYMTQL